MYYKIGNKHQSRIRSDQTERANRSHSDIRAGLVSMGKACQANRPPPAAPYQVTCRKQQCQDRPEFLQSLVIWYCGDEKSAKKWKYVNSGMQLTGEVKFTGVFDIEVVRERERARALDIMSSLKNYLKEKQRQLTPNVAGEEMLTEENETMDELPAENTLTRPATR
ncbi:hypothetical protein ANCCEY_07197 [Ancylostoma ceylanicum]|uniref:Uncharacterized protein n=1 Tax=Ancylostoma ceylanicum TaxID=53326 RepID=A0A0D6LPB3_9BILA|nr:hypothetical protein ANCCEY_07197 [Ancylostoma ceylanicum]